MVSTAWTDQETLQATVRFGQSNTYMGETRMTSAKLMLNCSRCPFKQLLLLVMVTELAARIPPELKLAQGGKGVLKEAARKVPSTLPTHWTDTTAALCVCLHSCQSQPARQRTTATAVDPETLRVMVALVRLMSDMGFVKKIGKAPASFMEKDIQNWIESLTA